jgi:hypothetical protein
MQLCRIQTSQALLCHMDNPSIRSERTSKYAFPLGAIEITSVLPNVPAAIIRSKGFEAGRYVEESLMVGLAMKVILSHEGSISESASRNHEDCE